MKQRVKELRWVRGKDIKPNPFNWRRHPREQVAAFRRLIDDVGFADVLITYEDSYGDLVLIDGHMRTGLLQDELLPAVVLDVDETEAKQLLASLDPIANMAEVNQEKANGLLESVADDVRAALKALPPWKIPEAPDIDIPKSHTRRPITCPACGEEFDL